MAGEKPSAKQGADPMSSRSMISQPPPEGAFRTVISWLRNARRRRDGAANGFVTPEAPRIVWFHRGHAALTGGQVKHSHYFEHVLRMPGFSRRITFSKEPSNETRARERRQLWPAGDDNRGRALGAGVPRPALPRGNGLALSGRERPDDAGKPEDQPHSGRAACPGARTALALSLPRRESGPDLRQPGGRRCNLRHRADEGTGSDDSERRRRGTFRAGWRGLSRGLREAAPVDHDRRVQEPRPCSGLVRASGCGAH